NVAMQLPPGSRGICNDQQCYVVLDQGPEGWTQEGSRIRLPESICQPRPDGRRLTVAVTMDCAAKTAGTPTCGAWSSAPMPIESPPPPARVGDACGGAMTRACGNCGTQSRRCQDGKWSDWSTCGSEGPCAPSSSQACGRS